jgi:hypothetical protein
VKVVRAGGIFGQFHAREFGPLPDLSALRPEALDPTLLMRARAAWQRHVTTEFRSIQIMTRFLTEVVGAGDPIDVYAGALDLVKDEIRHTELCAAVCTALGAEPTLPEPTVLTETPEFLAASMPERALATAITMLAINETLSVAFIEDLAARCTNPAIGSVLSAILSDEADHGDFGWRYVREALRRFPPTTLPQWKKIVSSCLEPHEKAAARALENVPGEQQLLEAHPEPELAALGLFSPPRQALVYLRTRDRDVLPRLAALELWPA